MTERTDSIFSPEYFPTLSHSGVAYFDNAASTQTHQWVLDAMNKYYCEHRSNSHRGSYDIAEQTTSAVEQARRSVADFVQAEPEQIAFTTGATQGLNMVANWCRKYPVVIVTNMEHNANLAPWLAQGRSVPAGNLAVLNIDRDPSATLLAAHTLFEKHAGRAVLSITAASNVCGTSSSYRALSDAAKAYGIPVCLDASQLISHQQLLTEECTGITWAVFSGHKMYGPTGVGALYSRPGFDQFEPLAWGGGNVLHTDINGGWTAAEGPSRMEAGTQNAAGMIGLGTAAELIGYATHAHIREKQAEVSIKLFELGVDLFPDLDLLNPMSVGGKILTFRSTKYHPTDIAAVLGQRNVAVRSGKLCANNYVDSLSNNGVLRVSIAPYNTEDDCHRLISGIERALALLA